MNETDDLLQDFPKNPPQQNVGSTLLTLCILTIAGSVFIMIKGLFSYSLYDEIRGDGSPGMRLFIDVIYILEFLTCLGAIVSAILMLGRKYAGFVVYMISSILYMAVTIVFAGFCILTIIGIPIALLHIFYLIPSVLFLVLYINQRKNLE